MTLFHIIFVGVRSAVLVVTSLGYFIRILPAVILILLGSCFCGLKSILILSYVGFLTLANISLICWWFMTKIQFLPLDFVLLSPCANLPTSFPEDVFYISLSWGWMWMLMSGLWLGPNWVVLPFDCSGSLRGATWTPCAPANMPIGSTRPWVLVIAEQELCIWGPLNEIHVPNQVLFVGICLRFFPCRSGLGRNYVGSTYRCLGREHTALRALDLCTSPSYVGSSGFTI